MGRMLPGRRRALIALLAALALTAGLPTATRAESPDPDHYSVQLGPEHSMFGPSSYIDMPFHAIRDSTGAMRGFIGNADTYELQGISVPRLVLRRGPKAAIDQCGSWLMGSVYKDPLNAQHWIGFYHAEAAANADNVCRPAARGTRWSMAYAESFDSGHTWTRPTYGRTTNQVVTQDSTLLGDKTTDDAGNARIVVRGNYFYMFYMAASRTDPNQRLHVARATLSSKGRPGSWRKYYCYQSLLGTVCGWGQLGIGGKSTAINLPTRARHITWNAYLERWIGVAVSGRYGTYLWESSDLLKWTRQRLVFPAVSSSTDSTVDVWENRTSSDKGLYGYPSITGIDLDPNVTGREFYLYYMRVYPGESMSRRYLIWRKVYLSASTSPVNQVELSTYRSQDGRRRTTTELPEPALGTKVEATPGYLSAGERTDFVPLFECRLANGDEYLRQNGCATGQTMVRRMGYISTKRNALTPTPLYRCYDAAHVSHFASADPTCAGTMREFTIGYLLSTIR